VVKIYIKDFVDHTDSCYANSFYSSEGLSSKQRQQSKPLPRINKRSKRLS